MIGVALFVLVVAGLFVFGRHLVNRSMAPEFAALDAEMAQIAEEHAQMDGRRADLDAYRASVGLPPTTRPEPTP